MVRGIDTSGEYCERLRIRFLRTGLDGLADIECVELLLTLAEPQANVPQLARALFLKFGGIREILDAPVEELHDIPEISPLTPAGLKIIRAASTMYLQRSSEGSELLVEPDRLAEFWRMRIGALPNEVFQVAFLDSGYRLVRDGVETLGSGTVDRTTIYPRRVIEAALKRGAAAIVLAHNHPNDSLTPSEHDKVLTRAIVLAAETVQIKVVDHLIVSAQDTFSFRTAGIL